MNLTFAHGTYLWFLLLVPVLILLHLITLKKAKVEAIKFSNFEALQKVSKGVIFTKTYSGLLVNRNLILLSIRALAYFFIIASVSSPILHYEGNANKFDLIFVVDTSSSMLADDISPTRIEATKNILTDYVKSAPSGSRMGLVTYAGVNTIDVDLGTNQDEMLAAISSIDIKRSGGTATGDALITASNMLSGSNSGMIVLVTDGQSNTGLPVEDAVTYAIEKNIIINAIGIGTEQGGSFLGLNITSMIDRESLATIAQPTKGTTFIIGDKDQAEESKAWFQNDVILREHKPLQLPLAGFLLFAGVLLLIGEFILLNTRYKTLP